jgi:hypothetical protein
MAEFIVVTDYDDGAQGLINTDDIEAFVQMLDDTTGEVSTYMKRKGQAEPTRIRESMSSLMMLLATPLGRYYPPTTGGFQFQPVAINPPFEIN